MASADLWSWFATNAGRIASNPDDSVLLEELDRRVTEEWPELSWEIGPDRDGDLYLAISPNLSRANAEFARAAIESAPAISGWRFLAARPRKTWNGEFAIETGTGPVRLNSNKWSFVRLQYPDGIEELVLIGEDARGLSEDERWHAAAIVLEGTLGEQCVLDRIEEFALVPSLDSRLASGSRPISALEATYDIH